MIAWPANLEEEKTNRDNHLIVDRFRLQDESDPLVSARVTRNSADGRYRYAYTIRNTESARAAIWSWKVIDQREDTGVSVEDGGWLHGFRVPPGIPAGKRQAIPGVDSGVVISWTNVD
ncbi:MAG: hypothetical protein M3N93_04020, partial [Acidobacteriota bacterium]|nr:hypothetical protein [Acidobacteriota bacterium]